MPCTVNDDYPMSEGEKGMLLPVDNNLLLPLKSKMHLR